jgi:hypothetical protein
VAYPFFFGNDDDFRNNRFKLIPKVVDGNMVVKMAVKDTPTLLGNKLKQYYYRVCRQSSPPLTWLTDCLPLSSTGRQLF